MKNNFQEGKFLFVYSNVEVVRATKNLFLRVSLFYLTLYIPLALMIYFPQWYTFNCKLHPRCRMIGYENALKYIDELTHFFLHSSPLPGSWTVKEKMHLAEVRDILDLLAVAAVICIVILITVFDRSRLSTYALVNLVIILSLLVLVPFFKIFWLKIFHPLLFNNDLWKNNFLDRSYYIMPGVFFKHSMIFLIGVSALLNALIWRFFRKYRK